MKTQIGIDKDLKTKSPAIPNIIAPGELGAVLELTLKDKNGRIKDHRLMESKSFVRQFLQMLFMYMMKLDWFGALPVIHDTSGGIAGVRYDVANCFIANAPLNDHDYGILVGGAAAPSRSATTRFSPG